VDHSDAGISHDLESQTLLPSWPPPG